MKTGKEYLMEHLEKTNIPEDYYVEEIGEMMGRYADYYEKQLVEKKEVGEVIFARWELLDK